MSYRDEVDEAEDKAYREHYAKRKEVLDNTPKEDRIDILWADYKERELRKIKR